LGTPVAPSAPGPSPTSPRKILDPKNFPATNPHAQPGPASDRRAACRPPLHYSGFATRHKMPSTSTSRPVAPSQLRIPSHTKPARKICRMAGHTEHAAGRDHSSRTNAALSER
ncbi:hypothetical protein T484DRAFT_3634191, partial [Baffinella frigidus]